MKLQIAGCIICEDAIKNAKQKYGEDFQVKWDQLISCNTIVEYLMPFKSFSTMEWTINWENGTKENVSLGDLTGLAR